MTMHNADTRTLVDTLNRNEPIRQSDSDIPRFGVQGNHQQISVKKPPRTIQSAAIRYNRVMIP